MIIARITPMPNVEFVKANHSEEECSIFFYNFTVIDLHNEGTVIQEETINQYILYESTFFYPRNKSDITSPNTTEFDSLFALGSYDLIAISVFISSFIMLYLMVFKAFLHQCEAWHQIKLCSMQVLTSVVSCALVSLIVLFFLVNLHKYYLKK